MYRYMHTARLYNSADEADVRPTSVPEPLAQVRLHLDYAAWHARLRGVTTSRPVASSPASAYQLDYATWHSSLQPANAVPAVAESVAPVVILAQPAASDDCDRQAA